MNTLKRYASLAKAYAKINLQGAMEYRAYIIAWIISNPLQVIFGLITVSVVISQFHSLNGWTFEQIAFMYGLGHISHGLSILFFCQTWYLDYLVTEGELDRLMVRPINVYFQFIFMDFGVVGITDLIPGVITFIYGCIATHFVFTPLNTLKVLLVIIGATALRGGIYTTSGALAFWTKRSYALSRIYLNLFSYTTQYPMSIFPNVIQALFTFIFPLGFLSYYPASEFFGISTAYSLIGSLCVWAFVIGIGFYCLGIATFNTGLKRYESSGS